MSTATIKASPARTAVLGWIETDDTVMELIIRGHTQKDSWDLKLAQLTTGVGDLAAWLKLPKETRQQGEAVQPLHHLKCIYGFTVGWIIHVGLNPAAVAARISEERDRQADLFRKGKLPFSCSHPATGHLPKLRILVEEVGEVAEAIDMFEEHSSRRNLGHLLTELTQVAAVTVAWLESLEPQSAPSAKSADKPKGAKA